jgi:thymidine phosphorylase
MKDGRGLEKLMRVVEAQGGDPAVLESREALPVARHRVEIVSPATGFVTGFDVEAIGRAGMLLGAGRARIEDEIDVAVGLEMLVRLGDEVKAGQPLAIVDYNDESRLDGMREVFLAAVELGEEAPEAIPLIRERLE